MACEICGNKPMNCDCSMETKRAFDELGSSYNRIAELEAEVEELSKKLELSYPSKYKIGQIVLINTNGLVGKIVRITVRAKLENSVYCRIKTPANVTDYRSFLESQIIRVLENESYLPISGLARLRG